MPAFKERIQWSPNCHARNIASARFGAGHTQEGDGTAASLANYLCNPNSKVSYHTVIDNDGNVVHVVDTDMASWSVGNGNNATWNYCYAGSRAAWTRQQWLGRMGRAIEIHAYIWVQDAKKYGKNAHVIDWAEIARPGSSGATDHRGINEALLKAKGHWDCGDGYPWDIFEGHVRRFLVDSAPMPEFYETEYAREANPWLGNKTSPLREETTPDGAGRFIRYENGYVYWSPRVVNREGRAVAFAVTNKIMGKYGMEGFEQGRLGYPVAPHLSLKAYTKSDGTVVPGGDVQAFEHGTIYEQDDDASLGYVVWGKVRQMYAALRYEMGPLGWPQSDEEIWGNAQLEGTVQRFDNGVIRWYSKADFAVAYLHGSNEPLIPDPIEAPANVDVPAEHGGPADLPGYVPTADEIALTPRDGMVGGVSNFATPGDPSTRGRNMGVSGEPADNPRDDWYCAMRFAYCAVGPGDREFWVKPISGTSDMRLKGVLPKRKLLVTLISTGRQIVVRPADWGPGAWAVPGGHENGTPKYRVIDLSPNAERALGAKTDDQVRVEWCDPSRPLGVVG